MTQMTVAERAAVETFCAERMAEFHEAANAVAAARDAGDREAEAQARSIVRRTYTEVQEARFVLETGVLPAA
jgi:hypothetical protein